MWEINFHHSNPDCLRMFYQSTATVKDQDVIRISTQELNQNYYDLEHIGQLPNWSGESSNLLLLILISDHKTRSSISGRGTPGTHAKP